MTRAVRIRYLKDENVAISDHLRNHIHLTNCIHLKNHMHRHSPILAERSLMRDLLVFQRSRSLRDPSMSPPSWHSPSVIDTLSKKIEEDGVLQNGRRSMEGERRRDMRRLSGSSPRYGSAATSKVAAVEVMGEIDGRANFSDRSSVSRDKNTKKLKGEGSSRRNSKSDVSAEKPVHDNQAMFGESEMPSNKEESHKRKTTQKGRHDQSIYVKTLSEQLKEIPGDSEDVEASKVYKDERHIAEDRFRDEPEGCIRSYSRGLNRVKKRKIKRRARVSISSRDVGPLNELSVASNSLVQGSNHPQRYKLERESNHVEPDNRHVTQAPRHGCGIPWNWSRIHLRGKTFLDIAGRSLSCGLSDSRLRKAEGHMPQIGEDALDLHVGSSCSSSSKKSDSDVVPLLIEPLGSHNSSKPAVWGPHDYSGELGIFANNHNLKNDQDSDLASEARSGCQHDVRGFCGGSHRSLSQKYMPKTFKDLVGQNLVVQALSNAVARRKVGLLYVFYGPHGTGKTSCARIFARVLSCLSLDHPKPCGSCSSCISHDLGKSLNVQEVCGIGNIDVETIIDLLENMISSHLPSQYRVLIVDDCDSLPPDSWSSILKVIELAPRRVVFIMVASSLDSFPHIVIARSQKFFFPKLKDADVIYTLQWIATKEGLEIDRDALNLIVSRSDGSLRDAEMTLDQLSLLGQRISITLVQELVGLISDEKLVDLLDLALSGDTVNTVKTLRKIMETGVEPLALMSQLATVITDILAGSYIFSSERLRKRFFRQPKLTKEDMEKLRQALKTLSEAEKQLRISNDRLTWLTAALLQLAPDHQYMRPSSSADTSLDRTPMVTRADVGILTNEQSEMTNKGKGVSRSIREEKYNSAGPNVTSRSNYAVGRKYVGVTPQHTMDTSKGSKESISEKGQKEIEKIWFKVLESIQISSLKQFMQQEGRLVSVSFGAAPTVQLIFSSHLNKSKAEKFRGYILQAFKSVLGSPVIIEIRCEAGKDLRVLGHGSSQVISGQDSHSKDKLPNVKSENHIKSLLQDRATKGAESTQAGHLASDTPQNSKTEIVEIGPGQELGVVPIDRKEKESVWDEETSSHRKITQGTDANSKRISEQSHSQCLVRSKVSLAHVIQQAEGCTKPSGWSKRKAISIAEKLEQENLRLESRSLLCWKASSVRGAKLSRFKKRRTRSLIKLVSCSRCLCVKSPN